jgi:hypothetical protein
MMLLENSRSEASPDAERSLGSRSHVGVLAPHHSSNRFPLLPEPSILVPGSPRNGTKVRICSVLAETAHPPGYQPVRPLSDIPAAVATCAIQVCFGARNVAKLSRWQMCWQADNSGQLGVHLGFNADVCCCNPAMAILFDRLGGSTKRDRFQYWKRSLFIRAVTSSGDACPQETSNARHVARPAELKTRGR